jgi:choline dehydrogenase-like flavoprotein
VTGGKDPVELGSNNSGQGVGGSTVHYSMIALRLHADDFRRRTLEGAIAGAHGIPNLFICDGSVFPTSGAVNPSLTIQAIAARTADRIQAKAATGGFDRSVSQSLVAG